MRGLGVRSRLGRPLRRPGQEGGWPGWPVAGALVSLGLGLPACAGRPADRAWEGSQTCCWEQRAQKAEVRRTGRVAFLLRSFCFLLPGPLGSALQNCVCAAQPSPGAARPRPPEREWGPPSPPRPGQARRPQRTPRPGLHCAAARADRTLPAREKHMERHCQKLSHILLHLWLRSSWEKET